MSKYCEQVISNYFYNGYSYNEIRHLLKFMHGVDVSERTLHRVLRKLGLYRRGHSSSTISIINFVEKELSGSGSCIGYRQMHQRCIKARLCVSRKTVSVTVKALDPIGVEERKRKYLKRRKYFAKGPNWVWHLDGYDKLKPYGFSIHGAIDGYSRRIMWLELSKSNKDPCNISSFYLKCIQKIKGVPRKVVADFGTENVYVAAAQRFFRRNHNDSVAGTVSFKYGKSICNQRIEALWSFLRRSCTTWWINFFRDLIESNKFDNTNNMEVECLIFCFYTPLLKDLINFYNSWNSHRIRSQSNTTSIERPSGRPDILYFTPQFLYPEIKDYKCQYLAEDFEIFTQTYPCKNEENKYICSKAFYELANLLMPENAKEGLILYEELLKLINEL
jgi:transposase